ncbi:hypothetical protein ILUMI_24852 [Ignelater luminosus]|uniref:Reverse transcriptase domain-containing protein n=1 Tax=Ignelater luminosus TaxID=2038154 RepID=A0A8K0FYD3_IGNLU|nr:hypothetical protein ILUMI_24852 [Ignelater luminosus]
MQFDVAGEANHAITDILYGVSLCALSKKDGGIRLIPFQLGFGTKGGCEAAVHCCRTFIHQNTDTPKVLLKIDFRNAFNTVERNEMLKCVKNRIPKLYNILFQCYSKSSQLFFEEKRILSQVGAQQGDPAGPLLFFLVIQAVIENLNSELNIFYLDDGTLGGDTNTVLQDLDTIIKSCWNLGLQINPSKCELYFCSTYKKDVHESFNQLSPGIKVLQDVITLLGAPLNVQSTAKLLNQKHDEIRLLFLRLKFLQSHIAYVLLRNYFAIPKLTYLLRTSPA